MFYACFYNAFHKNKKKNMFLCCKFANKCFNIYGISRVQKCDRQTDDRRDKQTDNAKENV